MKRSSISLVILLLPLLIFAESWQAELHLTDGVANFTIEFGRRAGASWGVDGFDEILALAPPSGPYAYFAIDDPENPYITMLYTDIRPDNADSTTWKAHLFSTRPSLSASWNSALLPTGTFYIGAHYPGYTVTTWVNMKTTSSISFLPAQVLDVVHIPDAYHPADSPVFSEWFPVDGSTGVPVMTDISFEVTDAGSGINPSSIRLSVAGLDVTSSLILTPIANGYRVRYRYTTPLPGNTWISVVASAEDNAFPPNSTTDAIAFRTGSTITPVLWEMRLRTYTINTRSDTSYMTLYLGQDPGGTNGFDLGMDVIFPVAPPGVFYSYFPLSDPGYPLYSMLTRDIHSSTNATDNWNIVFGNFDAVIGLTWETDDIPADRNGFIAYTFPPFFPEDDEWIDMRTVDRVEFGPGRWVWIKVINPFWDVTPPSILYTIPSSGETGVSVSTSIVVAVKDEGSGVDPASITMSVNAVDVTSSLIIMDSAGVYRIIYVPLLDFPPLSTISVLVGASDLAPFPNTVNYRFNFVTGYFITPTWLDTLAIWTQMPGEPLRHFTLRFGTAPGGTDRFDYGLDQPMPPPPPTDIPYGFFVIEDTLWNNLGRDIRSDEDEDILWTADIQRISPIGGAINWIGWTPGTLPEAGNFKIAWFTGDDTLWRDMRRLDRIDISTPGLLFIHYFIGTGPTSGNVFGTITTSDGASPEGTMIVLGDDTTYANFEGYYEFLDVPFGTYRMSVSKLYYLPINEVVNINLPENRRNYRLVRGNGRVVGTISLFGATGSLAGTQVQFLDSGRPPAYTNMSGAYSIADLPYNSYTVRISRTGYITLDTTFVLLRTQDTLNATLYRSATLNPPQNLTGSGQYTQRVVLDWDAPASSGATLLGYRVYRTRLFTSDTLVGYVSQPYTSFVEWNLMNYLPYTYKVTALYAEGESDSAGPVMVWINPDSVTPDIFIWDFDNGANLANGGTSDEATYLRNRILEFGQLNVAVSGQDASINTVDLFAFRAVFLITGIEDANNALPGNQSINRLASYIASGGRVYVEGADFGYDFGSESAPAQRRNLFNLFGMGFAADGNTSSTGNVVRLTSNAPTFFTEGAVNIGYSYRTSADHRIDEWIVEPSGGALICLMSQETPPPQASRARMGYFKKDNYKTVLSSVYIGAMVDSPRPSTRLSVIAAIINYLLGTSLTLIEDNSGKLPEALSVSISPNPFNSSCKICIEVDKPGRITLDIYDIAGRPIANLVDNFVAPGVYSTIWNGNDNAGKEMPSGIYFSVLKLDEKAITNKMMLIK